MNMQIQGTAALIIVALVGLLAGLLIGMSLGKHKAWYSMGGEYKKEMYGNKVPLDRGEGMMHGGMHGAMDGMTRALEGKTGEEFDRVFLEEMIVHHEGAVAMAEMALAQGARQEIKDLSNAIIDAQKKEIEQMKGWLAMWYRASPAQ